MLLIFSKPSGLGKKELFLLKNIAEKNSVQDSKLIYGFRTLGLSTTKLKIFTANKKLLETLSILYGRHVFPFQTLNFAVGTQQAGHNVHIHFTACLRDLCVECGLHLKMQTNKMALFFSIPALRTGFHSQMNIFPQIQKIIHENISILIIQNLLILGKHYLGTIRLHQKLQS